jgi:hypothetical protein
MLVFALMCMTQVGAWTALKLQCTGAPLRAQVEQMAKQLGVAENVSYTCETAAHFWLLHILARWEKFQAVAQQRRTPECVKVACNPAAVLRSCTV